MTRRTGWNRRELLQAMALAPLVPLAATAEGAQRNKGRGPLEVIVAGAGLAGLAAAYELMGQGVRVTVLEARMRPGGRVYTLREPFADGLWADAGGMDYSDGYRHYSRYVKVFDLASAPVTPAAQATVYHLRGKRLEVRPPAAPAGGAPAAPVAPVDWPFRLTAEETRLGVAGMFGKYFAPVGDLDDPTDPSWKPDAWKKYDAMTLAQFLMRQGASAEAIELLSAALWFGYGAAEVSALHRLLSDVSLFCLGQTTRALVGGSDMLPRAFAKALGERIRYGAAITRVSQQVGGVQVVFAQNGVEQSLHADRVICTLPGPALRKVDFGAHLPARKRQIFERLEYNPVTRVFLQTRQRSWAAAGESGGAFTDLPIQNVEEQPLVRPAAASGRGILECHVKGPAARQLAAMEPAAQVAFAAAQMEQVFPGFQAQFEVGAAVAWGNDPWAGGGYAWWKPGQLTDWVAELQQPDGRVHFAGEHTSWLGRTMEGALESGNRAAREVLTAPRPLSPLAEG